MNVPRWLTDEIDELGRRVGRGELSRDEAVGTLEEDILRKDDELARAIVARWAAEKLDKRVTKQRQSRLDETERRVSEITAGYIQSSFDEIYSDYWPRDTYGPLSTLEDLGKHDEDMLGLADRHLTRAQERHKRYQELVKAVSGNLQATWLEAELARLGLSGPDSVTAEG